MTNSAQDHGQQKPETVEDLAPRDDESADLKGGPTAVERTGASRGLSGNSGGGAGRS